MERSLNSLHENRTLSIARIFLHIYGRREMLGGAGLRDRPQNKSRKQPQISPLDRGRCSPGTERAGMP